MVASRENFPLLAELLAEQQRLDTPVARFSSAHDAGSAARAVALAQLIPLTTPGPGEQYAFQVELDSCTGCKSCVAACHSLNGLDETETWRDVGLLVGPRRGEPFAQTVTTACHHCADPACLNGCPVLAYDKDPVTGIVRHLDDQCIGCSYCVLKCPYDVPKYSERLGIVRKCDMCHGRLAAGEAPACAQACPTQAIRIVTVQVTARGRASLPGAEGIAGLRTPPPASDFLPGAPDASYTRPTTRYLTRRRFPEELIAADANVLRPQPPHWPLVIMLTLMPAAVGLGAAGFARASWAVGAVGLAASVFHLGQPLRAWRIFLGWRKSWLSREAMFFGGWFAAASVVLVYPEWHAISLIVGVFGLGCSAMIYVDTRREYWRAEQTFPRFLGTATLAALAPTLPVAAAAALVAKLAWEWRTYWDGSTSSRLQRGPLQRAGIVRDVAGGSALLLLLTFPGPLAWVTLAVGEVAERYLFFRAVDAPKMPGQPAA